MNDKINLVKSNTLMYLAGGNKKMEIEYDKWKYIRLISNLSPVYNHYLIDLMDKYNCNNLQEVNFNQAKEFYEKLITLKTRKV